MTNVTISKQGNLIWYRCEGHAGYGEKGKDIVCAAISILANSYANLVYELDRIQKITLCRYLITDSMVNIICVDEEEELKNVLKQQIIGFSSLEEQFPENIHMEWGEIKKANV